MKLEIKFDSDDDRQRLARMLGVAESSDNPTLVAALKQRIGQDPGPPVDRRPDFARRDQLIAEAVAAGKFTPSRAGHYKSMYDRNPQKAEATIAKLHPGVAAPTRASNAPADSDYPRDWLPENRVKPGGNTRSD